MESRPEIVENIGNIEDFVNIGNLKKASISSEQEYNGFMHESKAPITSMNGRGFVMEPVFMPLIPERLPQCEAKRELKIGPLTMAQRAAKIRRYMEKRKKRKWMNKPRYIGRQKVAETKLRINGRFISKERAFELLFKSHDFKPGQKLQEVILMDALPEVENPVFSLVKARAKDIPASHCKYHNKQTTTHQCKYQHNYRANQTLC
eukprot:TRINITY_DN120145_c1_g1_i1.p4 TRINITY_DN120145_c1_g1~~TRINITY_DN120145_c1_g1_i1.p4  ORF type:complete len:205 (+),score=16.87 TRINITY_DN120145_c1_g1_i1:670-1284(+)